MKNVLFISFVLISLVSNKIVAQPSQIVGKEKMKVFASWAGKWKGEGFMQMGPGAPSKSVVEESIELKLDGMIVLIEGIGKAVDPTTNENKTVHHAVAILSFDQATNEYKFNTYLKDGRNAQAWFTVLEANKYQWGFEAPTGKIKYSIAIDPSKNTWNEVGEFSKDAGSTWMKFFEMNLKKEN